MAVKYSFSQMPSNWEKSILELYKSGGTDVNARLWLRNATEWFTKHYWNKFIVEELEFRDAIERGQDLSFVWWLEQAKEGLKTRSFNNATFSKIMSNVFGWTDTVTSINVDQVVRSEKYEKMSERELMKNIQSELDSMKN